MWMQQQLQAEMAAGARPLLCLAPAPVNTASQHWVMPALMAPGQRSDARLCCKGNVSAHCTSLLLQLLSCNISSFLYRCPCLFVQSSL